MALHSSRVSDATAVPSVEDLVTRARRFHPLLKERARSAEENRRVASETMDALDDAGLLSIMKPQRFGGYEYGPSAMFRVGFEIGRACGSTAWCAMIANCDNWFAAYWPIEAQEELWGKRLANRLALTAVPTGLCEAASGGFNVSGKWPFASNCENSEWCSVAAVLPDGEGPGWFLIPMSEMEIDQDSWKVAGLQGTGSKTLVAEAPIFVPSHRVIRFFDTMNGNTPGAKIVNNPSAHFAFSTFGGVALLAPVLGMAQGALDWFTQYMCSKRPVTARPGGPASAADSPFNQERAGAASAAIDAAVTLLRLELETTEKLVLAGQELSVEQRLRVRRAIGFGAKQASDAVNMLFEGAGASATALDIPMQRFWRDVNCGARHVSLDTQAINTMMGQFLFEMPPLGLH